LKNLTLRGIIDNMLRENVLSADNQQGRVQITSLTPWYVAGFVDGEGSFHIAIYKDPRMRTQWKIIPEFHVSQRLSSRRVLDQLVEFFQCGYVKANHATNPNDVTYVYVVRNRDDLIQKIIPFFQSHRLITEKANDFNVFAKVVEMISFGFHRNVDGVKEILQLAYTMNGAGRYRRRQLEDVFAQPSETIRRIPIESGKI
jgi:hypothetical protein